MKMFGWKTIVLAVTVVLFTHFFRPAAMAADASAENVSGADSLTSLFTDGTFKAVIKTLWFARNYDSDKTDMSTLAIGGNLNFETAPLYGFSGGFGFKTSQGDLLDDADKNIYSGLLAPGDDPSDGDSYAALDEYFLRYDNFNTDIALGAFSLASPWMNGFDIRMTPKKYRGLRLINNSLDTLEFHGYYIADWLNWTAEDWESVAAGLSGNADDDEGSLVGGAVWKATESLKVQLWDYYFTEVLNALYGSLGYSGVVSDNLALTANFKYLNQQDQGDALAGALDTYMAGGDIGIGGYGAKLTAYYGVVGDDTILNPFGGDYVILMQTKWLERAEEKAWGVKVDYNFENLGVKGLSMYIFYASFDTPDSGENASTDMQETDFNIQYKLSGWFENLSLRFRYAHMDQDEEVADGSDWDDIRFHIEYRF